MTVLAHLDTASVLIGMGVQLAGSFVINAAWRWAVDERIDALIKSGKLKKVEL